MKTVKHLSMLVAAFILGGLISLGAGAVADTSAAEPSLPTPTKIGDLYGFASQDSYKGCMDFVEYDDPHGFCLDGAGLTDGESSLLGRAITGREMTAEETGIASDIIGVQVLRLSGASDQEVASAEVLASGEAEGWWQQTYGETQEGIVP